MAILRLTRLLAVLTLLVVGAERTSAAQTVIVFAAASLADGLEAASAAYRTKNNIAVRMSFAASSTLARQIEQGAPAQIFAAADEAWMTYLDERGLIERDSRIRPIGNRLVLIAPVSGAASIVTVDRSLDLAALLGAIGRLSLGDPAHVPAGIYAKQALETLGLWDRVAARIAPAENVRVALALVERGETPLGIVYATDARASTRVRTVGEFPPGSHAAIRYPFALVAGKASPEAKAFFAFLTGAEGAAVFRTFGFTQG